MYTGMFHNGCRMLTFKMRDYEIEEPSLMWTLQYGGKVDQPYWSNTLVGLVTMIDNCAVGNVFSYVLN